MSRWWEGAKLLALTGWLALANWALQGHFASRADAAREAEWRRRAEAVMARIGDGDTPGSSDRARLAVHATSRRSPDVVADELDHAIRREGLGAVRLVPAEREALYWVVLELVRRGYDDDELTTLLQISGGRAEWRGYR